MAAKIRLARRGRKKQAKYDIVVADSRAPRDSKYKEKLGTYNPNMHPAEIRLNTERALHWVMVGAQPTDTARSILSRMGVMMRKHLQVGVNKGAISQEKADERFNEWMKGRDMTNLLVLTVDGKEVGERAQKVAPEIPVPAPPKPEVAPVVEEAVAEETPVAPEEVVEEAPAAEEASASTEEPTQEVEEKKEE